MCQVAHLETRGQLVGAILSFEYVVLGQVLRFNDKCLYQLSHLFSHHEVFVLAEEKQVINHFKYIGGNRRWVGCSKVGKCLYWFQVVTF